MSRQLLGWVVTSVLLSGSIPATLAAEESSVEPVVSETVVAPGSGDEGCCPSCFCPRWTASAEFIILDRIGSVNQTLVERVPGNMPPNSSWHRGTQQQRLSTRFRRWTKGRLDSPRR